VIFFNHETRLMERQRGAGSNHEEHEEKRKAGQESDAVSEVALVRGAEDGAGEAVVDDGDKAVLMREFFHERTFLDV